MRIEIVATALEGLAPDVVATIAREAWLERRPADSVNVRLSSDGVAVAGVGTGLDAVFRSAFRDASAIELAEPGLVAWISPESGRALLDLSTLQWSGGADVRGSSAGVARSVLALIDRGARSIHLHLPTLMRGSDVGVGFLAELSGHDVALAEPGSQLEDVISVARQRLGGTALAVSYASELSLTGVNGMARAWHRGGFDGMAAQDAEREIGRFAAALGAAAAAGTTSLLSTPAIDAKSVWSGVGGGLALTIAALGYPVIDVGRLVPAHYWVPTSDEADLYVYITDAVGLDVPSGLTHLTSRAELVAAPAVLVVGNAMIKRGELPRLGLHGLYGLRAARESATSVHEALRVQMGKLATTWGWE